MNTCTSCCMPLTELESFDVASLPRAGEAALLAVSLQINRRLGQLQARAGRGITTQR